MSKEDQKIERTLLLIKPDGVQRGLIGEIVKRFEQRGAKISAMKMVFASKDLLEKHYHEHKGKKFFDSLVSYMQTGPTVALIVVGLDMIRVGRVVVGATNPLDAAPGTLRGDYAVSIGRNLVHASDSAEAAKHEISLWFSESDHVHWEPSWKKWAVEGDPKKGASY
jgi:nucleoside-diphosphate kinase